MDMAAVMETDGETEVCDRECGRERQIFLWPLPWTYCGFAGEENLPVQNLELL